MVNFKNIITDGKILGSAGVGLGIGVVLGGLMGVSWKQTAGIAAVTTIVGGLIGYSVSGESFSSAEGSRRHRKPHKKYTITSQGKPKFQHESKGRPMRSEQSEGRPAIPHESEGRPVFGRR
jgi:hypothetical protein